MHYNLCDTIIRFFSHLNLFGLWPLKLERYCNNSIGLPQELDRGEYSPVFARHFISEGITHGHLVVCIGERVTAWLDNLPKPIEQTTGN